MLKKTSSCSAKKRLKRVTEVLRPTALIIMTLLAVDSIAAANKNIADPTYGDHPQAAQFVEKMVTEHGFDRAYVSGLLKQAQRKQSILDAISRPAEKTKTWAEYRDIFVTTRRTRLGKEFMRTHAATLARAELEFGVPKHLIAAVIGVETRYGRNMGSYRVIDALATLGFDYPPRAKFFNKQLGEFLLLAKEQKFDATAIKGSYAGAMGFGQFIPSSYRHYAVDFDGDGIADIINNPVDAIGSVANYFKAHGWKAGQPVTITATAKANHNVDFVSKKLKPEYSVAEFQQQGYQPAQPLDEEQLVTVMRLKGKNGEELWYGLHNFYVITRYNHSRLYAMAVYQLSEQLKN